MTPGERVTSCYQLDPVSCRPARITSGPDEALWFSLNQANAIGRIDLAGKTTLYSLPTAGAGPVGITYGADNAVWFVEIGAGQVGRITMDGSITEFPLPEYAARPHAIVNDPDGGYWVTEWGRIVSPTSHRMGRSMSTNYRHHFPNHMGSPSVWRV